MASITFADRENASLLHTPGLKMRRRLQSAPDNILRTPMTGKKFHAPLQSGRKALGSVNKITSTPAVKVQEKNKILGTQEAVPQAKVEEYPNIEKCIPYDPLEFEAYGVPEEVVCLSHLALAGLARLPQTPCLLEEDEVLETCVPLSPLKSLQCSDHFASEIDAFLQIINELTIDLPPEMD